MHAGELNNGCNYVCLLVTMSVDRSILHGRIRKTLTTLHSKGVQIPLSVPRSLKAHSPSEEIQNPISILKKSLSIPLNSRWHYQMTITDYNTIQLACLRIIVISANVDLSEMGSVPFSHVRFTQGRTFPLTSMNLFVLLQKVSFFFHVLWLLLSPLGRNSTIHFLFLFT